MRCSSPLKQGAAGGTLQPQPLWTPPPAATKHSAVARLARVVGVDDYDALWRWSVQDVGRFWAVMWRQWDVLADGDPEPALADASMPGARWFPGVRLSYAEHVFRGKDAEAIALHPATESGEVAAWTWQQLTEETRRVRAGLRAMGVGRGDRVAGYLPNVPQTLAAFLATSSLGGVWSCCSPDFGARTVVDRFAQIEPKVLLCVDGYRYGGKEFSRAEVVAELREALPTVEQTVTLGVVGAGDWDASFPVTDAPLAFERVPFDWPLWIVYSSGTTGLPKAIVHGHGGALLEGLKTWRLTHDVRSGDRVFWFTTTGWIMWNYLAAALLSDTAIVLYDGNPTAPDRDVLWKVADAVDVAIFGTGAAYIHGCMKAGVVPRADGRSFASLRSVGSTGSPLSVAGFEWIRDQLGEDIWTCSVSGGTDVAGAFLGGAVTKPVYAGELSARLLGVAVEAWNEDGQPVADEVGELVVTAPMPSMPVKFWNDPGDARYRESYFSMFPGVWRHGDWLRITDRGSAIIYGRSDATINRGGIRIGTAEIYAALRRVETVTDALVVDVPAADGAGESRMTLFVVSGAELEPETVEEIRRCIREDCSPRHVPDEVVPAPAVPTTLTGKLLEVPVKKLLMGWDARSLVNPDALQDPDTWSWFVDYAARRHEDVVAR
jgi:acetoacetyl-CoA synthetase